MENILIFVANKGGGVVLSGGGGPDPPDGNPGLSGVIQVLIKTQNVYCSRHQCSKG